MRLETGGERGSTLAGARCFLGEPGLVALGGVGRSSGKLFRGELAAVLLHVSLFLVLFRTLRWSILVPRRILARLSGERVPGGAFFLGGGALASPSEVFPDPSLVLKRAPGINLGSGT